jgi:hypothetical protein
VLAPSWPRLEPKIYCELEILFNAKVPLYRACVLIYFPTDEGDLHHEAMKNHQLAARNGCGGRAAKNPLSP